MDKLNLKYKGIIFDLDGTLLNTIDDLTDSINYAMANNNFKTYTVDEAKYLVGSGVDVLIQRSLKDYDYSKEVFEKVKNDYLNKYVELQKNKTKPYPGIVDMLLDLKSLGVKVGIVSNKPHSDVLNIIKYYFNEHLFTSYCGKKEGYLIKPDPRSVNEMIEFFDLPKNEILYCGDSDVDMMTAQNAEVTAIGVSWGFRKKEELKQHNPQYIVDEPRQIVDIVEGKN